MAVFRGSRLAIGVALSLAMSAGAAEAGDAGDFAGAAAASLSSLGQGLGDAMTGGPSLFVTATGHAKRPAPAVKALGISVEGKAPTAVQAAQDRDRAIDAARSVAAKFGIPSLVVTETIDREADSPSDPAAARMAAMAAASPPPFYVPRGGAGAGDRPVEKRFVARAALRFLPAGQEKIPMFLDALVAAGVPFDLADTQNSLNFNPLANLGLGSDETIDQATWDQASADAMASAKRQAKLLAGAAGEGLGDVRQVLQLLKNVQGDQVSVTVAVRFALTPAR
jgi:uncharacterized protein YggE